MKNLKEIIKFRHTIKDYDKTKDVSAKDLKELMEFTRWAPTSMNWQTVKTVVVDRDAEINKKMKEFDYMMFNNNIVETASKIIYFVVPKIGRTINPEDEISKDGARYGAFQREGIAPKDVTDKQITEILPNVMGAANLMGFKDLGEWSTRQAYIKLGYITGGAVAKGIDTTSMEGVNTTNVSKLFAENGFINKDEQVVLAVGLGYRSGEKAFNKSQRKDYEWFVTEVKK